MLWTAILPSTTHTGRANTNSLKPAQAAPFNSMTHMRMWAPLPLRSLETDRMPHHASERIGPLSVTQYPHMSHKTSTQHAAHEGLQAYTPSAACARKHRVNQAKPLTRSDTQAWHVYCLEGQHRSRHCCNKHTHLGTASCDNHRRISRLPQQQKPQPTSTTCHNHITATRVCRGCMLPQ
jgi:hypothetical protein